MEFEGFFRMILWIWGIFRRILELGFATSLDFGFLFLVFGLLFDSEPMFVACFSGLRLYL